MRYILILSIQVFLSINPKKRKASTPIDDESLDIKIESTTDESNLDDSISDRSSFGSSFYNQPLHGESSQSKRGRFDSPNIDIKTEPKSPEEFDYQSHQDPFEPEIKNVYSIQNLPGTSNEFKDTHERTADDRLKDSPIFFSESDVNRHNQDVFAVQRSSQGDQTQNEEKKTNISMTRIVSEVLTQKVMSPDISQYLIDQLMVLDPNVKFTNFKFHLLIDHWFDDQITNYLKSKCSVEDRQVGPVFAGKEKCDLQYYRAVYGIATEEDLRVCYVCNMLKKIRDIVLAIVLTKDMSNQALIEQEFIKLIPAIIKNLKTLCFYLQNKYTYLFPNNFCASEAARIEFFNKEKKGSFKVGVKLGLLKMEPCSNSLEPIGCVREMIDLT